VKTNILFLLVDSLRSDKVFGTEKPETPILDLLIKKGVYFNQAFSPSDYTVTGYGSIFTGCYPINAGIDGMSYHKIYSKYPNYLTKLKENGYHIYGTTESSMLKLGILPEFENGDCGYDRTTLNLFNGLGEKIASKFAEFTEPWFYFIHLEDLHIPIRVPDKYNHLKYSERYDLVVSNIDSWIGKLLEKIDLTKTIIVMTADHGDYILSIDDSKKDTFAQKIKTKIRKNISPASYDFFAKIKRNTKRQIQLAQAKTPLEKRSIDTRTAKERFLYDDLIHIPLLLVGGDIPAKGIIHNLVRQIDIFPTLTELITIPQNEDVHGRSLIPLINGQEFKEESVYLENTIFATEQESPQPCVGIRTSQYKYFRSLNDSRDKVHLFNVREDPLEENNIIDKQPDLAKKMEHDLVKIREKLLEDFKPAEMSDDEIKDVEAELKKLGYI
jgi:arylsulfatase A-like enzyme